MRRTTRILLLILGMAMPAAAPHAFAAKNPRIDGETLPFRLHELDGTPVASSDERFGGKIVLLDLWGTWCAPCIGEIPTLNDLQARYGDHGLQIVGIAFERIEDDAERRAHLEKFAAEHRIGYLLLDGGWVREFEDVLPTIRDVKGFPIEVVIGRDGEVVDIRNGYGYSKRWARKLEKELAGLLGIAPRPAD